MDIIESTPLINVATREYPVTVRHIYALNPKISFPTPMPEEIAEQFGFAIVHDTPKPKADVITEGFPTLSKGKAKKWTRTWIGRPFSESELAHKVNTRATDRELEMEAIVQDAFANGISVPWWDGKKEEMMESTLVWEGDVSHLLVLQALVAATSYTEYELPVLVDGEVAEQTFHITGAQAIVFNTVRRYNAIKKQQIVAKRQLKAAKTMEEVEMVNIFVHNTNVAPSE